ISSDFLEPDNRAVPKSTLSQHFKIFREAGLIRRERKGVELHNTSRCEELEKHFGEMVGAIVDAYSEQNKSRSKSICDAPSTAMALTRIPMGANSKAQRRVRYSSADLLAP